MKKLLSFGVCCAIMMCIFLSACTAPNGQQEALPQLDPKKPVSLEIWHYYNGPQKTAFDNLVREFNETVGLEQGIIVEAFSQGNVEELLSKVVDAAAHKVGADDVPDVFAAYADTAYEVDKLGLLADLDPYLSEDELAEYRPEFIAEGRIGMDGALKIFPIAKSVELLMLNQTDWDKFADATGAQVSDLSTIEGITSTAESYYNWTDSLTLDADDGKAFFGRDAMANYFIIGCRQLGIEIFSGTGKEAVLNPDKEVLRQLWDNYYVPFVKGWFSASGNFRSDSAHMGDIIALVGSSSGSTYFPTEVAVNDFESYPIEAQIFPAPIFEGGEPFAVQQGAGMCVTKSDVTTEYAATIFLKWFTEADRNVEFSVGSGYLPVKNAALDKDLVNSVLDEQSQDAAKAARMKQTLSAAIDELASCEMYTTKAFENGNACRSVLERSMGSQASADRQAVLELMAQGVSQSDAVAQYATDERFDSWYTQFVQQLETTQQVG